MTDKETAEFIRTARFHASVIARADDTVIHYADKPKEEY